MESKPNGTAARSQLQALADAEVAARTETYQRSAWWTPWVAALVGPTLVAAEVLSGAQRYLILGGFVLLLGAIAIREERKPRVRRRFGFPPGRLGWFHFGFLFVFISSLNLGRLMVDRVNDGVLAAVSFGVYLAFFRLWVLVFNRMIDASTAEQPNG